MTMLYDCKSLSALKVFNHFMDRWNSLYAKMPFRQLTQCPFWWKDRSVSAVDYRLDQPHRINQIEK